MEGSPFVDATFSYGAWMRTSAVIRSRRPASRTGPDRGCLGQRRVTPARALVALHPVRSTALANSLSSTGARYLTTARAESTVASVPGAM